MFSTVAAASGMCDPFIGGAENEFSVAAVRQFHDLPKPASKFSVAT
jgi:hypothetical protein